MKEKTIFFLIMILLLSLACFGYAQEIKIRVSVNKANIRLHPNPSSPVISLVHYGLIFQPIRKTEEWYFVELLPNEEGDVIAGYIHQSVVEEIEEGGEKEKEEEAKIKEKVEVAEKEAKIKKKAEPTAKEEKLTAESSIKIISARRAERINAITSYRYHTAENPKENVLLVLRINNISEEKFDGASERKEIYITDGQNQHTPGITSVSYIFGESKKICYILIFSVPRTILKFKFIISDYSVSFEADKEIADQLSMSELCK